MIGIGGKDTVRIGNDWGRKCHKESIGDEIWNKTD